MENKKDKKSVIKKRILTILFVLLNIGVIVWTATSEYVNASNGENKAGKITQLEIKWWFLIFAVLCFLLVVFSEVLKYAYAMKRTCGYIDWKVARRVVLLGKYYDNITPSGIGGQPYQIYYLRKHDMTAGQAATITVTGFMGMQVAFILLALYVIAFGGSFVKVDAIRIMSYIGIVFYALFPIAIIFFTFFNNLSTKIMNGILNFLYKIHIVKNKEKWVNKITHSVADYVECIRGNIADWKLWVVTMVCSLFYQLSLCSLPFFVIHAYGGDINFIECLFTTISIYCAITFIPTPGNAGAAEVSFALVFATLTSGAIFWATLTWRFLCYYIFLLIGVIIYIIRYVNKKKNIVPEESK